MKLEKSSEISNEKISQAVNCGEKAVVPTDALSSNSTYPTSEEDDDGTNLFQCMALNPKRWVLCNFVFAKIFVSLVQLFEHDPPSYQEMEGISRKRRLSKKDQERYKVILSFIPKTCTGGMLKTKIVLSYKRSKPKTPPSQPREPLMPPSKPNFPFQKMVTDLSDLHGKNYIVYTDRYTGWTEVAPVPSGKAVAICNTLRSWFCTYGAPEEVLSDGGPSFDSLEYNSFSEDWGIKKCISSAHNPQSNGQAELAVKTAKRTLMSQWRIEIHPPIRTLTCHQQKCCTVNNA